MNVSKNEDARHVTKIYDFYIVNGDLLELVELGALPWSTQV